MTHIKNQKIDGKKTICGLSNQYKDADTMQKFNQRIIDKNYIKIAAKNAQ
jgi:hypothetical protein